MGNKSLLLGVIGLALLVLFILLGTIFLVQIQKKSASIPERETLLPEDTEKEEFLRTCDKIEEQKIERFLLFGCCYR